MTEFDFGVERDDIGEQSAGAMAASRASGLAQHSTPSISEERWLGWAGMDIFVRSRGSWIRICVE